MVTHNCQGRLNPQKCHFGLKKVQFLGHKISEAGIEPCQDKIKAMKEFPVPKNIKALRSFVGLVSFYRRYIFSFSTKIAPLFKLLKKDVPFVLDGECQDAFDRMKTAMVTAPILRLPVLGQKFYLLTDASREAISYTLGQKNQDMVICLVGYGEQFSF